MDSSVCSALEQILYILWEKKCCQLVGVFGGVAQSIECDEFLQKIIKRKQIANIFPVNPLYGS